MKPILVVLVALLIFTSVGCRVRVTPGPSRRFAVPEYRTKNHWGAPKYSSPRSRYWSQKRYGPKPHPNRGRYRY